MFEIKVLLSELSHQIATGIVTKKIVTVSNSSPTNYSFEKSIFPMKLCSKSMILCKKDHSLHIWKTIPKKSNWYDSTHLPLAQPYKWQGAYSAPLRIKIAFLAPFCDPIDLKKFDFSQISMKMPPILFRSLIMACFYSILVFGRTKIRILKWVFWPFWS